jgi:hypothetical protein
MCPLKSLQRKTLFALQEKQYLKTGKENVYSIDPFQVANMRTVDGGFYVMDVIASVHKVIHNKVDKESRKISNNFPPQLRFRICRHECSEKINHPKLFY